MIARAPRAPVDVPPAVARLAGGGPVRCVWVNEVGGRTFELGGPRGARRFVKWAPAGRGPDLGEEALRLRWARPYTPVPEVLGGGADHDGTWMVLGALAGESAVSDRWRSAPERAVRAVGEGLRALHEALPVAGCPFSWSAEDRAADARRRGESGALDPGRWHAEHRALSVGAALERAARPPSVDRLVVCHGDACAPNTLVTEDGRWSAHVDLGRLGVGDRWADLAVATWSTVWNYGPGFEAPLLEAYGVDPDGERTAYYRLLWDLGS
ncbi:MAG: aminoglycoside 3'-phosphotransferase [Acidobacteriota bacterium]|nr:aminoglycoside 3'-phosphotransferase [Acidobacteriota bacterium]